MKFLMIFFVILCHLDIIKCQNHLDTLNMFQSAELKFFLSENLTFTENDFKDLIVKKNNISIFKFIKSTGIKDMVFFELNFDQSNKNKHTLYGGTVLFCYDIITNQIFIVNDHNIDNIKQFTKILKLRISNSTLMDINFFSKSVYIEDVNTKKLYFSIKKMKKFEFSEINYYKIPY